MAKKHKRAAYHDGDLYNDFNKIKAALADTTRDIRGKAGVMLSDSLENAKDRTMAGKEMVEEVVAERPFKSLGVAMLAGLAIGYLIHK